MCCCRARASLGHDRGRYSEANQPLRSAELGWEVRGFHGCVSAWLPIRLGGHFRLGEKHNTTPDKDGQKVEKCCFSLRSSLGRSHCSEAAADCHIHLPAASPLSFQCITAGKGNILLPFPSLPSFLPSLGIIMLGIMILSSGNIKGIRYMLKV